MGADDARDPLPGDFDAELTRIDATEVVRLPGDANARLSLRVTVEGDDAAKLRDIAQARGQRPSEVIAELLRSA